MALTLMIIIYIPVFPGDSAKGAEERATARDILLSSRKVSFRS